MKELMIDYLDGNLTGELKDFVARHIEQNDQWKTEFKQLQQVMNAIDHSQELTPDDTMKTDFEAFLSQEMENQNAVPPDETQVIALTKTTWFQMAAAVVLLIVGAVLGIQYMSDQHQQEILALQQEIESTKQLVINSLKHQSASSRINAVNISYKLAAMDDDIVEALIFTLNNDVNTNVRLAALDALSEFAYEDKVRHALIQSLKTQDKPLVQIALINLMVNLKEIEAIQPLQDIIDDEKTLDAVKEQADYGLFKLS